MINTYKNHFIAMCISMALLGCSNKPDTCADGNECTQNSQSVSEATTQPKSVAESVERSKKTIKEPMANTQAIKSQPNQESSLEPSYKKAFSVFNFSEQAKNSAGFEEVISDMGFYSLEAEDALKDSDIEFVNAIDNIEAIPLIVNGKTLKTINAKSLMKEECCGYIVVQNAKPAKFIALAPGETANLIKSYFANE